MLEAGDTDPPIPKPRSRLQPLTNLDYSEDIIENGSPNLVGKKKKKSSLSRLKDRKQNSVGTLEVIETSEPGRSQETRDSPLMPRLDGLDIADLPSIDDVEEPSDLFPVKGMSSTEDITEPSTPTSSRKKKKHKGALSRLKDKRGHQNGLKSSPRSEEMPDHSLIEDDVADFVDSSSLIAYPSVVDNVNTQIDNNNIAEYKAKLEDSVGTSHSLGAKTEINSVGSRFKPVPRQLDKKIDMKSAIESEEDDSDSEQIAENYQRLISSKGSTGLTNRKPAFPIPTPSTSTPLAGKSSTSNLTKSDSMPNISESIRSSKRNWDLIKSKIGLEGSSGDLEDTMRRSASAFSINTTTSSGLHTVRISAARHKNFLVGQKNTHSSVMGASELDRTFPDRSMNIFVGTWNMAELRTIERGIEDFLLPTCIEYVPDVLVITSQENDFDRKEWEVILQETLGPNHVIYHSAQHGTLHIAVCMKRELIWFCSKAEDDTVTVRAFKQIKTKGAVAVSFTMFGTSFLFIGSHFKANEGNEKARVQDYLTINKSLRLPRAVVDNPLKQTHPQCCMRFDCVFWAGDLNFRITKDRDMVLKMIDKVRDDEHPHFEHLLENDELTLAMNRGEIFEDFQEGQIRFPPTYKFDIGTIDYDTSPKYRIPSYTDRILFKSKRKHGIVCQKYNSASEIKCSDHKPVYGLYQVNLKPGGDAIPLSGGQFRRDVYIEAAKRRALRRVAAHIKPLSENGKSSVCLIS